MTNDLLHNATILLSIGTEVPSELKSTNLFSELTDVTKGGVDALGSAVGTRRIGQEWLLLTCKPRVLADCGESLSLTAMCRFAVGMATRAAGRLCITLEAIQAWLLDESPTLTGAGSGLVESCELT